MREMIVILTVALSLPVLPGQVRGRTARRRCTATERSSSPASRSGGACTRRCRRTGSIPAIRRPRSSRACEIAKARGLVIDLRGSVGGNAIYYGLIPYLLTGPTRVSEDSAILASPSAARRRPWS